MTSFILEIMLPTSIVVAIMLAYMTFISIIFQRAKSCWWIMDFMLTHWFCALIGTAVLLIPITAAFNFYAIPILAHATTALIFPTALSVYKLILPKGKGVNT